MTAPRINRLEKANDLILSTQADNRKDGRGKFFYVFPLHYHMQSKSASEDLYLLEDKNEKQAGVVRLKNQGKKYLATQSLWCKLQY